MSAGTDVLISYSREDFQANFQLTTAVVPEPAAWAMMLVGFGGLGGMLRNRRSKAALAA